MKFHTSAAPESTVVVVSWCTSDGRAVMGLRLFHLFQFKSQRSTYDVAQRERMNPERLCCVPSHAGCFVCEGVAASENHTTVVVVLGSEAPAQCVLFGAKYHYSQRAFC